AAPATDPAPAPVTDEAGEGGAGSGEPGGRDRGSGSAQEGESQPNVVTRVVTETVDRLVKDVPESLKAALAALAALSVLLGIGYLLAALRARRLARQRRELLQEVGLLQTALLPPVPDKVGALLTSVAYRPADGPGAGGDFYDVLPLAGGRVGFILGDVSGHGRGALARTAFMRYTLRAYLEAGLEPRIALQVAGRVIDDNLGGDFATVLLAVHDPETGSLTYATAGHPAPIVVGPQPHDPVTAGSSPPIGVGVRTGLRQTTVPLVPGSVAALFTDGLMEARTEHGILGRERLAELLEELGEDAGARRLIERVATESTFVSDDMAAVVVTPTAGVTAGLFRTEQLELSARELEGPIARRFLDACGLPEHEAEDAEREARLLAERFGGVILHVVFGNRLQVEVLPRNVESIEAASRRVSAGSAL
ncbi:MAG: PP2C family protein-serine/threonine phosphatase, partial [Thermoleophilaceae bacterium]